MQRSGSGSTAAKIERLDDSLKVLPAVGLESLLAQQEGRVIGRNHGDAPPVVLLPPHASQRSVQTRQPAGRGTAQCDQNSRLDGQDLALQVPLTRIHLLRLGIPVAGGTALQYIRNVNLFTLEPHRRDDPVEQLPCWANKRLPTQILLLPRSFPHEHQVGIGISGAKCGQMPGFTQVALTAVGDPLRLLLERCLLIDGSERRMKICRRCLGGRR